MVKKKLIKRSYYFRNKKEKIKPLKIIKYIYQIILIFILLLMYFFIYIYKIKKEEEKYYAKERRTIFKKYNESNIITFNDKINWILIHDTNKLKGKCADKILLHDYAKKKIGKDICNKILKIYNNEEEIDLNQLPQQFILKTNHGSGYNIIVEDKNSLNFDEAKKQLKEWLKIDYGKIACEFHYSFIKKKIFAEEYIGKELKNYKFLCYDGKPKYVYLSRTENGTKYRNFYDMNWTFINFVCLSQPHPTYKYEKPKFFELMKEYAKKLASDFKFVRVDLYELENEVRLGELTFSPMNTFFSCRNRQNEIDLGKDIDTKERLYDFFIYFLGKIGYYG